MLTGFLRTIILFFVTAVVLRLMGKRQLAQLQPAQEEVIVEFGHDAPRAALRVIYSFCNSWSKSRDYC